MLAKNNQKDLPKVSIILPVYNVEKYLRQCMESILHQTLGDIEIIAVNDGSTDSSPKLLDEYALRDSRVYVIHQQNKGTFIARQEGFRNSTGQYILFVDPDDWIEPDTCEFLYAKLKETEDDMLLFGVKCENEGISRKRFKALESYYNGMIDSLNVKEEILKACYIDRRFTWNLFGRIFSRTVLEQAFNAMPAIRCSYAEDVLSSFYILSFCKRLSSVPSSFYHYRIGVGISTKRAVSRHDLMSALQSYNLFSFVQEFAKEHYNEDPFITSIIERIKNLLDEGILILAIRLNYNVKLRFMYWCSFVGTLAVVMLFIIFAILI